VTGDRSVIDDPPGGNNNGRFDPGETGDLALALRNVGNQTVAGVHATLRSSDVRFTVTDSVGDYDSIPACSTRTNADAPFKIAVDPSIPLETPVLCTLFVTGASYSDTLRFTLVVGEIRACDPIPDGPRQPAQYWAYDNTDSAYVEHPEFSWVEINTLGTRLNFGDDETYVATLPPDFTWRYYGQDYSQVSICGNGWVGAGSNASTSWTNTELPSTSAPSAIIAANWDDLYPPIGNGVWYYYDASNRRFIVEWDSISYLSNQSVADKFQVIIADTTGSYSGDNQVTVQYLTANGYGSNTVGLQDQTMAVGIQCLMDGAYHRGTSQLAPGSAIRFTDATPSTAVSQQPGMTSARSIVAWPNPFSGSVRLSAPAGSHLRAAIYDNCGRLVRTLNRTGRASEYVWDGLSDNGRSVAPGIYFFRVAAGTDRTWTKLVLTR
jgi:hypothetical protein